MKYAVCLIACALPLAACNKGPQVSATNASMAEVAQKVHEAGADKIVIHPGLWQSKVTIEQFDMPGMPADVAETVKKTMAERQQHSFQNCVTPEEAQRPKEEFFAGKNNECRYDHFTMGGGKIDAVMHCGKAGEGPNMQMAGSYSPDSYDMHTSMAMQSQGNGMGGMTMKMHVAAQRVGECTAQKG